MMCCLHYQGCDNYCFIIFILFFKGNKFISINLKKIKNAFVSKLFTVPKQIVFNKYFSIISVKCLMNRGA